MTDSSRTVDREAVRSLKPVLYNPGGYVAHIAIKLAEDDSFNAFTRAANLAHAGEGRVEALYEDSRAGSRTRVLGVERAGLVIEPGSLADSDRLTAIEARLRDERKNIKRGKGAQALDRLISFIEGDDA